MTHPLDLTYNAGQVRRYHTNAHLAGIGQPVNAHSWNMLAMLYYLHPSPGASLVRAITLHDLDELMGGDLSYPFKKAHPEHAKQHADLSRKLADDAGMPAMPDLNKWDHDWLDFLDRLECWMHVRLHRPELLNTAEWTAMGKMLMGKAVHLGCYEKIGEDILPSWLGLT